jgi:hypothetical protein
MSAVTVAGPFDEQNARETARYLGDSNHSVYSRAIRDAEGFDTDAREWFVERDNDAPARTLMGYDWSEIQRKQMRR